MREILDEPFKEEKEIKNKRKRTDFQKATRHTWIGWVSFIICVVFVLIHDMVEFRHSLAKAILFPGIFFSLFNIIAGTYYKLKGQFS